MGSVLVYNDRIIGEGWHEKFGESHAEVNCLENVAASDRHLIPESTIYVSLEPCAHFGKTPPCANRIVAEGIKKVVVGMRDPFSRVNGKGIAILQDAGIEVVTGVLEDECRWQNKRFLTFHEKKRPYLHLKWAQTADGFMSGENHSRLKISSPITDRLVHKWRSEEAAIMVGSQTALLDDPQLTNRWWTGPQPVRIVVDRELRLPESLKLFSDNVLTLILNEKKELQEGAVRWLKMPRLSADEPELITEALYKLGIQSVLIEGGASLLNSFINKGLWDEVHIITNRNLMVQNGLRAPLLNAGIIFEEIISGDDKIVGIKNNGQL
ncbi:MAG: bifunctional diaminohydroxyphosphoribosylaminopyrimidine deaminase/5-amino-6-(5-phosphoribosylamino)uracil reductase RibD [Chitinophagaceae bacterium]|nr:bifunctional diaminohydroxyphosphoribosylaminopyrimidine deaminase/5-amino-6-(5-phosphoribosylamino)uracil reductase RibD [Chitinophagaceae bacterium]